MKWILSILILISAASFGQIGLRDDSTKYIRYQNQYGSRLPRFWADSALHMPYFDTAIVKPQKAGAIMMHLDKNVYKWNGGGWNLIVAAGTSTALSNIGTGYRIVKTADGQIKTIIPGYGTNIDSAANELTISADTTELVTPSDLADAKLLFTSMSSLRSYNTTSTANNTVATLSGFYESGDGGGGMFIWNNTSTVADDSGTVIKSTPVTTGRWLRIYNNPINVAWFGAIPNGSRVVTNALQNALNKTGHVYVPYSNRRYIIDDRLLIKSNTLFDIHFADTIYLADGTNTVMIRNFTTDTVGITDHNITVRGGIWDNNWTNNQGTNAVSSVYLMLQSDKTNPIRGIAGTLDFVGIRHLKVLNLTVRNGHLFPIHISHGERIEVGHIFFDRDAETISDGVHLSTPQYDFYVHDIAGKNGDDVVALGAWEWLIANPGGQSGDIRKGTIERIKTDTCAWSLVKMYTGNTGGQGGIYDVVVKDIKGISKNQAFYWGTTIDQANPEHTTGYGKISNVTMTDIHAGTLNAQSAVGISFGSVVLMDCHFNNVVLKNITMDTGYTPAPGEPWLRSTANVIAKSVTVENFNQLAIPTYGWLFDLDGQGNEFNLTNSTFIGTGSFTGDLAYQKVRVVSTGNWGNIHINNNKFDGVAGALWTSTSSIGAIVNVENNIFRNYNAAVIAGAFMNLSLTGNNFYNGATSVVSSVAASRIYSAGNVADIVGSGVTLVRPSGSVQWVGTDLPVNAALLTPTTYDMVNNTNAGAGDLGVVQYTGSAWVSVTSNSAAGASGNFQYNNAGALAGTADMLWDPTNIRVGIGTTTPDYSIDVERSVNSTNAIRAYNPNAGASAAAAFIMESDGGASLFYRTSAAYGFGLADMTIFQETGGGDMAFYGAGEIARFKNGGNVLIGTTSDNGAKLQVNGDATVTDEAYDATAWNGNLEVPTKNAIRDKIESMSIGSTIYTGDGTLASPRTISTDGHTLALTGANDSETSFSVTNTGSTAASAIAGNVTGSTGAGVTGTSTAGNGVVGNSTSNYGVAGISTTGQALRGQNNPSTTNAITNVMSLLTTSSSGGTSNGFGSAIQYELETATNGTSQTAGSLAFKWSDATNATRTSDFEIHTVNSTTSARKAALSGAGQWTWDTYGIGTHSVTPATTPVIASDGTVGERVAPKIYTVLLSQTGTSDPTATVLGTNEIGSIVWTRNSVGNYTGTLTGAFTANKTWLICQKGDGSGSFINGLLSRGGANTLTLDTRDNTNTLADNFTNMSIEVRVYP
jgi:hypothetical protein